jgi:hypothetical protein
VANGITFKAFDATLKHWVSSQGDDYEVDTSANLGKAKSQGYKRIKIIKHTTPSSDIYDRFNPHKEVGKHESFETAIKGRHLVSRKLNPVLRNNYRLNRARVVAMFFIENEFNHPFVGVLDGDIYNLSARNVCWTEKNLFPQLNMNYEQEDIVHDITIQSPSIRVLQESMELYGREKSFSRINVPIQHDLLHLFKTYGIPIQSAVYTSLRLISQWSFCVYSVEYSDGGKVFVGYSPLVEGVYKDRIMQLSADLPWLNEIASEEGYGVLKLNYLTMSQTRKEARASCEDFLNRYNNNGWVVMNDDFYHDDMERTLSVSLTKKELDAVNSALVKEHGVGLQKYLEAVVKKQKIKANQQLEKDDA